MCCYLSFSPRQQQLTPLAELSIPRRSTTAPMGLPPSTSSSGGNAGGPAGALMSPHQFAHSTSTTSMNNNAQQGEEGSKVTTTTTTTQEVGPREPVGLSRDQLQQALLYLIKVGAPCNHWSNEHTMYMYM